MHPTLEKMLAQGAVLTDGAWGTELQSRGLEVGSCPDAWNLTHPDRVEEVAAAYVNAGSQLILTNTFGANRFMLQRHNLPDEVVAINRAGVEISKRAAGDRARVFASVGPSGIMLMMGEVSEEELKAVFVEQVRAVAEAGADGISVETMTDPAEAKLAIAAAKETGLPVVGCMCFDAGADKDRTMMGTTPEEAVAVCRDAGADVIGSNCGQGIEGFAHILKRLKAATDLPIWIKANAGLPEIVNGQAAYRQTAAEFARFVPPLIEAGATFVGGCCGTTPDFIRAVRDAIKAAQTGTDRS